LVVPPFNRSIAVSVKMLIIRYVPGEVLKGEIVEEGAEFNEVDEGAEEAVGVALELVDCCCCGVPVLELDVEGTCAVLCDAASPPPNPPPNAAPTTKSARANTIQNVRVGSPHMRGGVADEPTYGGASLDAA
jgi:hypothetical protein